MEYMIYGDLVIICPKPYFYLRETINCDGKLGSRAGTLSETSVNRIRSNFQWTVIPMRPFWGLHVSLWEERPEP